jgi:hypothetical protein
VSQVHTLNTRVRYAQYRYSSIGGVLMGGNSLVRSRNRATRYGFNPKEQPAIPFDVNLGNRVQPK